jgi:hypothetical protein
MLPQDGYGSIDGHAKHEMRKVFLSLITAKAATQLPPGSLPPAFARMMQ